MPEPGWSLRVPADVLLRQMGIPQAQRRALARAAETLRAAWVDKLNQPGSGATYNTGFITTKGSPRRVIPVGERVPHTASAPGEPPAPDTGAGRTSIVAVALDDGDRQRIGTNKRYLFALEFGVNVPGSKVGQHPAEGFKIEPRPHARPVGEQMKPAMNEAFSAELGHG